MRQSLSAVAIVATLLVLVGIAQTRDRQAPVATGTLTLAGTVLLNDGTPPPPVRRARVTLSLDGSLPTQIADTDTEGAFRFDNLPAGTYRIVVEKPGFIPVEHGPGRGFVRPLVFTLNPGVPVRMDIVMQRAAAMAGQILNDKGEPAAGVLVSAVRLMYGPYGKRPTVVRQVTTDDLGRFRVHTLASGEYYLDSAPDPMQAITGPPPAGDRQGLARSYYPGTPRLEEARILALASSQELTNLDFRLTPVRLSSVKGNIVDASGRTPAVLRVQLQRVGAPPGEVRSLVAQPGAFQFPAVPPGEYWLLASAQPLAGADLEFAAMRVTVSGQDLAGLALTTTKGAAVNGQVEVDGGGSPPSNLQVLSHEIDFELPVLPPPPPGSPAPGAVGADGTFTFPSVFGSRLFRVDRLPESWALKSVFLDGADVTDAPAELGGKPRALRVVITNRTATVGGTIEAARGGPSAGRVVVFIDDPRQWGLRSRGIRTVEARADGVYAIGGLLPGKYFIVAVDELDDGAWYDPDVLARLQPTAAPLVVTEGQKATVALTLK